MDEYVSSGPANDNKGDGEFREFCEFPDGSQKMSIVCEATLLTNNQGLATKVIEFDKAGKLQKVAAVNIYEGEAERISVKGLNGLSHLIKSLPSNRALCFGVAEKQKARLLTQETLRSGAFPNAIARDREHFQFLKGKPGILMLDCDARPGVPPLSWQKIDDIIADIIPAWGDTQRLWRASSSAFLYRAKDGSELIGAGSWRCYVMVDDASAIPEAGAFLYQALWAKGHGYILVSRSGQHLVRSLIDASVWQPERVDFAAEPVLAEGIIRQAPKPVLIGTAPLLSTTGIKAELSLGEWRQVSEDVKKEKEKVAPEVSAARKAFVAEHANPRAAQKLNISEKRLRSLWIKAVEQRVLTSDFMLHREDGSTVTVGEVLADAEKWHQARFADPLEPDYRNDKRIAFLNLEPEGDSEPYLYSHAHGGMCFKLVREAAKITLKKGERARVLDTTLTIIRGRGDVFERGGEMVKMAGSAILPFNDPRLSDYLSRHIRFTEMRFIKGEWKELAADPPVWLCQQLNAKSGERGLRDLRAVITAPILRPDGSLLCTPGYDEATGLLLKAGSWPHIPEEPTKADLHRALKTLWTPFAKFPFVTKQDRAVMVACLLTAVVRPILPLAPAFSFDAPDAGTGKTLLAKCVLRLCGALPTAMPACKEEDELRKSLLAALREGKPGILLDNVRGQFGSAALEAFLTSEHYADRILQVSTIVSLPTNVLFLISGNNFHPTGDLYRRLLTTRIDAQTETPERRCFEIEPLSYCRDNRQELVAAALTLLRGFVVAGKPRLTPDRLASFEDWDDLIRQGVLWLAKEGIADLGDPTACIQATKTKEPERQKLAAFLEATAAVMEDEQWKVADLKRKVCGPDYLSPMNDSPLAALYDALEEIAGERGKINSRILGRWIERHADKRCAGYYLERCGTRQHAALWRIHKYAALDQPKTNSQNSQNSREGGPRRVDAFAYLK